MAATPRAIGLHLGEATALVLPGEGGVLIDLDIGGVRPLAAMPWLAAPIAAPPAPNEDAWVRRWHGGWQLCFPSAGQPSAHDHSPGFHGAASQAPWTIVARGAASVTLAWTDGLVAAERRWTLTPDGAAVETSAWAIGVARDVVVAEHLILGPGVVGELGSVEAELDLTPGARVAPLAMDGSPDGDASDWPGLPEDRWQHIDDETPARVTALVNFANRRVRVVGPHATATVSWRGDAVPHALLWEELGATAASPWLGRVVAVGVEPTSAPHGLGTGRGDGMVTLRPGSRSTWTVRLAIDKGGER